MKGIYEAAMIAKMLKIMVHTETLKGNDGENFSSDLDGGDDGSNGEGKGGIIDCCSVEEAGSSGVKYGPGDAAILRADNGSNRDNCGGSTRDEDNSDGDAE